MKNKILSACVLMLFVTSACKKSADFTNESHRATSTSLKQSSALKDSVQAIINKYIQLGIPGIEVAVKTEKEAFIANGGYARLENQKPMNTDETDWIFSITKTYTASLVMKQVEKGVIDLDATIDHYLPKNIADSIVGTKIISVRMLLNHTSGIISFTDLLEFIEGQYAHPLLQPSLQQKLQLVNGQPLLFTPGTDFSYSNTNFLLLHVILEYVSGKPYEWLLQKQIIQPLHLSNTYYNISLQQAAEAKFLNYYYDATGTGDLVNGTAWNIMLGNTSLGYGGIAAKANDVIKFYEALVNGRVVSQQSFAQMTTWIQGRESTEPDYGLGIEYFQSAPGTTPQFGHEGDGVGCTTQIMYVPDTHSYVYVNCTAGRKTDGPFLFKTTDFKHEMCALIAQWRY